MLCITPTDVTNRQFSLSKMCSALNIDEGLATSRVACSPAQLTEALNARELTHPSNSGHSNAVREAFHPVFPVESVQIGAFYLEEITKDYERVYKRRVA